MWPKNRYTIARYSIDYSRISRHFLDAQPAFFCRSATLNSSFRVRSWPGTAEQLGIWLPGMEKFRKFPPIEEIGRKNLVRRFLCCPNLP